MELEAFPHPRTRLQNIEQPDLATAAPIPLVDRITRSIPIDETLSAIDNGSRT